jgi:pyroglutamyl-peptidase
VSLPKTSEGDIPRPTALILGFGPFGEVTDNPSSRLALAANNTTERWHIVGREMPVSYRRSVEFTATLAARLKPDLVLGVGVATGRDYIALERIGRNRFNASHPDIDGRTPHWSSGTQDRRRRSRLPNDRMAEASGIRVSDDCGRYVCNGWLYTCLGALPESLPVGFLHLPRSGCTVDRLHQMLSVVSVSTGGAHA